jgi:hypothetical protein
MQSDIEKIPLDKKVKKTKSITMTLPSGCKKGECCFKVGAIFCTNAENAATAFKNFGFDMGRSYLSYNRQLLHEAGCAGTRDPGHTVDVNGHLRIATPSGWVSIVGVVYDSGIRFNALDSNYSLSGYRDTFAYVAEDYLSGDCNIKIDPEKQ